MLDDNTPSPHIKPAAHKPRLPWINWRCLRPHMPPGRSRHALSQKTKREKYESGYWPEVLVLYQKRPQRRIGSLIRICGGRF
jgi:hypothetical protein